ncbi:MAG: hypothetical protein R3324_00415 [Halobacteriales archaeon]|nr:hypothetical protein [Halobacteriales archaeon]
MAVTTADIDLDDLDAIYPRRQLDDSKALRLKSMAVGFTNHVTGGAVARLSEIEGSESDFAVLVWAHLVELRAGGERGSESQTGGSVTYAHLSGDLSATLSETRYGRMARGYLRGEQSIGVVRGQSGFLE